MPNVFGPLLSLSASGAFGKTVFYYDTKYGARVRKVKGQFPSYGEAWEVNKEWFKKASDRWKKVLLADAKLAWNLYYSDVCDIGRDIFMGRQIEFWNLHPTNDITYPLVSVQDIGVITFGYKQEDWNLKVWWDDFDILKVEKNTCAALYARKFDDPSEPGEDDIIYRGASRYQKIGIYPDHDNYIWGGARYFNGEKKMFYIGKFVYP